MRPYKDDRTLSKHKFYMQLWGKPGDKLILAGQHFPFFQRTRCVKGTTHPIPFSQTRKTKKTSQRTVKQSARLSGSLPAEERLTCLAYCAPTSTFLTIQPEWWECPAAICIRTPLPSLCAQDKRHDSNIKSLK